MIAAIPAVSATIPDLPHAFSGNVQVNGVAAPTGTAVSATVSGGTLIPGSQNPVVITTAGSYGKDGAPRLLVQGTGITGATITFYVNGVNTGTTAVHQAGGGPTVVDLSIKWIETTSSIAYGAVNPVVTITGSGFKSGISPEDLTIGTGTTGLTFGPVTYVSGTQITVGFNGTAAAGDITIQTQSSAFDQWEGAASNTVTVTVPDPASPPTPGGVGGGVSPGPGPAPPAPVGPPAHAHVPAAPPAPPAPPVSTAPTVVVSGGVGTIEVDSITGAITQSMIVISPTQAAQIFIGQGTVATVNGAPVTSVTISEITTTEAAAISAGIPQDALFSFLGMAVRCGPAGAIFSESVGVTFGPYSVERWAEIMADAGGDPSNLAVKRQNAATGEWERIYAEVNPETRTITPRTNHFSLFAVFTVPGAGTPIVNDLAVPVLIDGQVRTATGVRPDTALPSVPATPATHLPEEPFVFNWMHGLIGLLIIVLVAGGAGYYLIKKT